MRKVFKVISLTIIAILVLLFAFVLAAPSLISTSWLRNALVEQINKQIPGSIAIGKIDLSWFGKQDIESLILYSPEKQPLVKLDSATIDLPLFKLISSNAMSIPLSIRNLQATLSNDEQKTTNIEGALGIKPYQRESSSEPVSLENVNAEINLLNQGKEASVKASGNTKQGTIQGNFALEALLNKMPSIKLKAQNFPVLAADQILALQKAQYSGLLLALIGEKIDISLDQKGPDFTLEASSSQLNLHLAGRFENEAISLNPESMLNFSLAQENVKSAAKALGWQELALSSNLKGKVTASDLRLPLDKTKLDLLAGQANISLGPFSFEKSADYGNLSVDKLDIALNIPQKDAPKANIKAEGKQNGEPFSVDFLLNLPKEKLTEATPENLIKYGLSFEGEIKGSFDQIKNWIEGPLDLSFAGNFKGDALRAQLTLNTDSFNLTNISLSVDAIPWDRLLAGDFHSSPMQGVLSVENLQLQSGIIPVKNLNSLVMPWKVDAPANEIAVNLEGKISDQGQLQGKFVLNDFFDKRVLNLAKATMIADLAISSLDVSQLDPLGELFQGKVSAKMQAHANLNGKLAANLKLDGEQEGPLKSLDLSALVENHGEQIAFDFKTQHASGTSAIKGSLANLFNSEGGINLDSLSINIDGNLKHFPTALLCNILSKDKSLCTKAKAVFGTAIDAAVNGSLNQMNGPLALEVAGQNGTLSLQGQLVNGALTLRAPLQANVKVTKELELLVLKELIPFLNSIINAEEPIQLVIEPQGFYAPLKDFSMQNVAIGQAALHLHKITFSREGEIGRAVSLLGLNAQSFEVWFTPLYFSMQNGTFWMSRVDMLVAHAYPVAAWGGADFSRDMLNMSIGLSGLAISKAFGIQRLPQDFMLQIPLIGPIARPQLDTGRVAARLSALALQAHARAQGTVLGNVIDAAAGTIIGDTVPPPTTNPLPWENEIKQENEPVENPADNPPNKESMLKNPEEMLKNPVKGLKKEAGSFIRGLLGK